MPVIAPTLGVWIVTVPTFEPVGQAGSTHEPARNWASVQPTRSPRAFAEALSDVPCGSVTTAFLTGDWLFAGSVSVVVNAAADAGALGAAEKATDGEKFAPEQPVTDRLELNGVVVPCLETSEPEMALPEHDAGLIMNPDSLIVSASSRV